MKYKIFNELINLTQEEQGIPTYPQKTFSTEENIPAYNGFGLYPALRFPMSYLKKNELYLENQNTAQFIAQSYHYIYNSWTLLQ